LLSPSAALAQVANQDFVFGTSSQLAREESPTVLKDLQAALSSNLLSSIHNPFAGRRTSPSGAASDLDFRN
jgi:hypothetical protein